MSLHALRILAAITLAASPLLAADDFAIKVGEKDHVAVSLGDKVVAKFMIANDTSTPERRLETYKPYLHLFDAAGQTQLTKGAGFQFTHHRGIFLGFSKISYDGKSYDRWHMKGGDQVVKKITPEAAGFVATIEWQGGTAAPILNEARRFTFSKPAAPFYLGIDMTSALTAVGSDAVLGGDPEHAGAQFRASEKVDTKTTTYVLPGENTNAHKQKDLPWAALIFTIEGKTFTSVILNHPSNPRDSAISAYRDYGRFGAFPKGTATATAPFQLHYQWLIAEGDVRDPAIFQKAWNAFAGKNDPVPPVTISLSEQPKPKAPATPAKK